MYRIEYQVYVLNVSVKIFSSECVYTTTSVHHYHRVCVYDVRLIVLVLVQSTCTVHR